MPYKTIVLELLRDRQELHQQLRRERLLLAAMEHYAQELKLSHQAWKDRLALVSLGSGPSQIASAALEMALAELEARLPAVSPRSAETPSLDEAMDFLRQHMLNA